MSKAACFYVNSPSLLRRCEEIQRDGQCARTFRCLHRQDKRRGSEEEEKETLVSPPVFIVIPLTVLQVGRNRCGSASAVLRSALCSSVLELWASLLPAAHRFSRDPEHGLPQRLTNFITTFPQLCWENQPDSPTHSQSNPTSSFPLTSYLISDIMGKSDLCEWESFKIHGK